MEQKQVLELVVKGQVAYEKIVDKEIHYVFLKDRKYKEIILRARKENFMHLCGITYTNPKDERLTRGTEFYKLLKKKRVSPKGINIREDGTTEQKLQVINSLSEIIKCQVSIIDERMQFLHLDIDKGIRSQKCIFCLSLLHMEGDVFSPLSLLNLKTSGKGNSLGKGYPVHCIYSVDQEGKIQYLCKTEEFMRFEENNAYNY